MKSTTSTIPASSSTTSTGTSTTASTPTTSIATGASEAIGEGSTSGGGGSSEPVVSYSNSCADVTNLAVPNSFSFNVGNQTFTNAVDNYVGSNYTSIIVNGTTYVLYLNESVQINGQVYMQLLNVSYLPILHSVTLEACPDSNTLTANAIGAASGPKGTNTINVSLILDPLALINIQPANFSESVFVGNPSNVPDAPYGSAIYSTMSINAKNVTNSTTIEVEAKFQCGLNGIVPYALDNGTWDLIEPFAINESACIIAFAMPPHDSVIAMIVPETTPAPQTEIGVAGGPAGSGSSVTTVSTSTIQQVEESASPAPKHASNGNYLWMLLIGSLFVIVPAIAGLVIARSRILYSPDIEGPMSKGSLR